MQVSAVNNVDIKTGFFYVKEIISLGISVTYEIDTGVDLEKYDVDFKVNFQSDNSVLLWDYSESGTRLYLTMKNMAPSSGYLECNVEWKAVLG